eukprot:g4393.t1
MALPVPAGFSLSSLHLDEDEFEDVLDGPEGGGEAGHTLEDELFGELDVDAELVQAESELDRTLEHERVVHHAATVVQRHVRGRQSRSNLIEAVGLGIHDSLSEHGESAAGGDGGGGVAESFHQSYKPAAGIGDDLPKATAPHPKISGGHEHPMEHHSWFTKLGLKYVRGGKIIPLNQTGDEMEAGHLHYKGNGDIDDTVHHRESKHGGVIYKHPGSLHGQKARSPTHNSNSTALKASSPKHGRARDGGEQERSHVNGLLHRHDDESGGSRSDLLDQATSIAKASEDKRPAPVGENMFPKQFYTRKRHPTMLEPNPKLDTLKPHPEQECTSRRGKWGSCSYGKEEAESQKARKFATSA